jgi:hypothetical protein
MANPHCSDFRQPFAVPAMGTAIQVDALSSVFGDLSECAFAFIPAFDFSPAPVGLAVVPDTHRNGRRKRSWVTRDGSDSTRNWA